jgi:ATP/maltotriose-dependent transcriptional regulator MalT
MTMSFLLHESPSDFEMSQFAEPDGPSIAAGRRSAKRNALTIVERQLRVPTVENILSRGRLFDLLDRSRRNFAATLISGRASTGKTTLAADYAATHDNVFWYSVSSADASWEVFANYFFACLRGSSARLPAKLVSITDEDANERVAAEFLRRGLERRQHGKEGSSVLIVLDDIHHLFDSSWFEGFFQQLILSLTPDVHLLMTCRSKPPAPLWRLRSKQMLNVVDESLLDFSPEEVREFCRIRGLPRERASTLVSQIGGRIGRLAERIVVEDGTV